MILKRPGKTRTGKTKRNFEICKGIMRFSKSKIFHRRRLFQDLVKNSSRRKADLKKHAEKLEAKKVKKPTGISKLIGGEKNGGERVVLKRKMPRHFPTEKKVTGRKHSKKVKQRVYKPLRASLLPGKILILVAGPHRGKRVVYLDRLPQSGLLLVTGPYRLNGCPLRRVHPTRVIATTEMVPEFNLAKVIEGYSKDIIENEKVFFTVDKKKNKQKKSKEEDIFESTDKHAKEPLPEFKKEIQRNIDTRLLAMIDGAITENEYESRFLKKYLSLPFSLAPGQYPHKMVF